MAIYNITGNVLTEAYYTNGENLTYAYDFCGNEVFNGGEPTPPPTPPVTPTYDYDDYTLSSTLFSISGGNFQGFAVHNGIIAQFGTNDKVRLISVTGEAITADMYCRSYHGQSAFFTDDYHNPNDEFPLLVVMGSYVNQWVNRITRNGCTLMKTIYIPTTVEYGGYKLANAYDPTTKRMYTLGYTTDNYNDSEGGTNKLILATWNYANLIDNGDNTYTPELLSIVERSFLKCVQGSDFYNGLLWVTSTSGSQTIRAIDPVTAEIVHTITLGGKEVEGCQWVGDDYIIVGQNPSALAYKKVTFAEVTEEES